MDRKQSLVAIIEFQLKSRNQQKHLSFPFDVISTCVRCSAEPPLQPMLWLDSDGRAIKSYVFCCCILRYGSVKFCCEFAVTCIGCTVHYTLYRQTCYIHCYIHYTQILRQDLALVAKSTQMPNVRYLPALSDHRISGSLS